VKDPNDNTKFSPLMRELWELTGKIGTLAEENDAYCEVYSLLSDALDFAEATKLITYGEE
jgi:hypothetical protein